MAWNATAVFFLPPAAALPLRNLLQKAAEVQAEAWSFVVSENAARASVLLSTFLDDTFAKLDILRPASTGAGAAGGGGGAARGQAVETATPATLQAISDPAVLLTGVEDKSALLQVCRAICESQKLPCVRPSDVTGLKAVRSLNLPADKIQPLVLRSFRILHLLGLGVTSLSANMAGSKTLYFTKLPEELLAHPQVVQAMRSILDAAAPYRTQTQAAMLLLARPPKRPSCGQTLTHGESGHAPGPGSVCAARSCAGCALD